MPSYSPAKRATAWIGYVSLVSQADTKLMKSNPTIAAGDFKVSIDGGALANLATLPTVTPASSVVVKISLSSGEMTADNVTVVCIDAAGAEWCDLVFNLQPSVAQLDDLATTLTAINAKTTNLPSDPADASDITAAFAVTNGLINAVDDLVDTEVAAIKTVVDAILVDTGTDIPASLDAVPTAVENADALLNRDMAAVTVTNSRSPINALRMLRNKVDVGVGTVYREDDSTAAWTFTTVTDAGAAPIVTVDPA